MSDYFGALMRSSGMAVGGRVPGIVELPAVEPSVVEIDVEDTASRVPPRAMQASSWPQPTVPPIPVAHPVDAPAPRATEATDPDAQTRADARAVLAVQAPFTSTAPAHAPAAAPVTDPAAASTASQGEPPTPALGQALVHAAMRWVAADPQEVRAVRQGVPPIVRSSPLATGETGMMAETPAHAVPPAHVAALPPRPAVESVQAPDRAARSAPPGPPMPRAPAVHDDVVEISIGAIHVRVDAPAAQTVARQPVTPSAAPPRSATAVAPRSALSRRALRRI